MALHTMVDTDTTPGHIFRGDHTLSDYMTSNGTADMIIFGFGGDDVVNPGINISGHLIQIYGSYSLPGFGNPTDVVGTTAQLNRIERNTMHVGQDIWAKDGAGPGVIEVHGPSPKNSHAAAAWLDFFEGDTLIIDNSRKTSAAHDGIEIYGWKLSFAEMAADGVTKIAHMSEIDINGMSLKPGFDQAMRMIFDDDRRGVFHELEIEYTGTIRHEISAYVAGLVDNGDIL